MSLGTNYTITEVAMEAAIQTWLTLSHSKCGTNTLLRLICAPAKAL